MTTFITLPPEKLAPLPAPMPLRETTDWVARVCELAPAFDGRAAAHDEADHFVADNFKDLKAARMFSAGLPASCGGGGASYAELCDIVRTLAHSCGSTALAFSMHCHLVSALVWQWRHLHAPIEGFLESIADRELVLVSSVGSDWLQGSGRAEAMRGGYRVSARKAFCSGSPAGDLLLTSAVFEDAKTGPTVLHFSIPLDSPHVKIVPNWRALGMRGTGSHELIIEDAFVPEAAISLRRPSGRWHFSMHLGAKMALPLIYAAYVGLAEKAREIALEAASDRSRRMETQLLAGEMENLLFSARIAHKRMVELGAHSQPGPQVTNDLLMGRRLVEQSAIRTVEKAMELVGGRAFHRSFGLERIYRDVQAARFHPLPEKPQQLLAGRVALGLGFETE